MQELKNLLLSNIFLIILIVVIIYSLFLNNIDRKIKLDIRTNELIGIVKEIEKSSDKLLRRR